VGCELSVRAEVAAAMLEFLLNGDALFRGVQALAGCATIRSFRGRFYQMRGNGPDRFDWHDDLVDGRLVALSINLGDQPFDGGVLEIADAASRVVLERVANVVPGDAVLFQLSTSLVHRVTPVTGTVPKLAFAGWFCSGPSYLEVLATNAG